MELDLQRVFAQRGLSIGRVLHIGAHVGQEAELYLQLGAPSVTWVEGNPEVVPRLREHVEPLGQRALEALLSDRSGDLVDFHVTNNEWSSSMLALGTHREEHPDVVVTHSVQLPTVTLDELCARERVGAVETMVLDVQGAESLVLGGGPGTLSTVRQLVVEVNERELYADCALLPELDAQLRGFDRVETTINEHSYGDALYLRHGVGGGTPNPSGGHCSAAARQRAAETPVFIICRDRAGSLGQLISWLERAGSERIILLDNASTFPPLLEYYRNSPHEVIFLEDNVGQAAVWDADLLTRLHVDGPFVVTDPDIVPIDVAPLDAIAHFQSIVDRHPEAEKVGFGLQIADLPDWYAEKARVARWEAQYWTDPLEPGVYRAPIDTTFAVYAPGTGHVTNTGFRTGWPYLARHDAWYVDSANLSVEERYYRGRASADITTWNRDEARPEIEQALAEQRNLGSMAPLGSSAFRPGEAPELDLSLPDTQARLHHPRFSVVMPARGHSERLERAVRAIVNQDYGDWELIIKSSSGGVRDRLPDDARIHVLEGPDRNLTHAVNEAIAHATGDVFYWANDDDQLLPGALRFVAEHLGDAMWLRGRVRVVDERGRELRIDGDHPWDLTTLKQSNMVCEPGVFWRRECVDAVGVLDESVPLASDYEYWLRLGDRWEPRTVDAILGEYTERAESLSVSQGALQAHQGARIYSRYAFAELARARIDVARLQERNRALDERLCAIEDSEWWRLTAPMRRVVGALKGRLRPRSGER